MNNSIRILGAYRKFLLNLYIQRNAPLVDAALADIKRMSPKKAMNNYITAHRAPLQPYSRESEIAAYNIAIIDLEGNNPVKLAGLWVGGMYFSCLLEASDPTKSEVISYYKFVLNILKRLRSFIFFGFTFWDYDQIFGMRRFVISKCDPANSNYLRFLDNLLYLNLQDRDRESISEALYSMGAKIPRDPLYRKNYKINTLHQDGYYDIIHQHNRSCLEAEIKILEKRFLRRFLLEPQLGGHNKIERKGGDWI